MQNQAPFQLPAVSEGETLLSRFQKDASSQGVLKGQPVYMPCRKPKKGTRERYQKQAPEEPTTIPKKISSKKGKGIFSSN